MRLLWGQNSNYNLSLEKQFVTGGHLWGGQRTESIMGAICGEAKGRVYNGGHLWEAKVLSL